MAKRVYTLVKRRLSMFRSRKRKTTIGPRTFKSEESARKYAETNGITNYKLVDLQEFNPKRTKIKIVVE